jgi:hypothetical protein
VKHSSKITTITLTSVSPFQFPLARDIVLVVMRNKYFRTSWRVEARARAFLCGTFQDSIIIASARALIPGLLSILPNFDSFLLFLLNCHFFALSFSISQLHMMICRVRSVVGCGGAVVAACSDGRLSVVDESSAAILGEADTRMRLTALCALFVVDNSAASAGSQL